MQRKKNKTEEILDGLWWGYVVKYVDLGQDDYLNWRREWLTFITEEKQNERRPKD